MKTVTVLTAVLAACALPAQDPRAQAEAAIRKTLEQKSYRTRFKARLEAPGSDPLLYEGGGLWISPAVLYLHFTGSGGANKNAVRAGTRAEYACPPHAFKPSPGKCPTCGKELVKIETPNIWVHHPIAGWVTADELGDSGVARGMQNPDEVLRVLVNHLSGAKARPGGGVSLAFGGADIERIMREQAQRGAFDWSKSDAAAEFQIDSEGRLKSFSVRATLTSTDPNVRGRVNYVAEIEVVEYNGSLEMKFLDEARKEIPLEEAIRKTIEETLKEKR
jgi:hypothetical protein